MNDIGSSASKPRLEQQGVFRTGRAEIADEMKCRLKFHDKGPAPKQSRS